VVRYATNPKRESARVSETSQVLRRLEVIRWAWVAPWLVWLFAFSPNPWWRQALQSLSAPWSFLVSGTLLVLIAIVALFPQFIGSPLLRLEGPILGTTREAPRWLLPFLLGVMLVSVFLLPLQPTRRSHAMVWILLAGFIATSVGFIGELPLEQKKRRIIIWGSAQVGLGVLLIAAIFSGMPIKLMFLLSVAAYVFAWVRSRGEKPATHPADPG
jgi:hypothetical protein